MTNAQARLRQARSAKKKAAEAAGASSSMPSGPPLIGLLLP
ncbi:hypothetical protein A2U01_0116044, partial [Trifolium medium]|nr:hypothetical protein [Trifolium medium]